jgi:hypothetical protein
MCTTVLCTDRFNDFSTSTAVAPVREACAQLFAAIVYTCADGDNAHIVDDSLSIVSGMYAHCEWTGPH